MADKTNASPNGAFSVFMSDNDLLKKASSLHLGRNLLKDDESIKKNNKATYENSMFYFTTRMFINVKYMISVLYILIFILIILLAVNITTLILVSKNT